MYTLSPIVQLWIVALLIPAGFLTPPKKDTCFSNTPNFTSPEKLVDFTLSALKPSATRTFDQSAQLQPWPVSLAISSEDSGRYSDAIFAPHISFELLVLSFELYTNSSPINQHNL
jgi:hypothetical protein